MKLSKIASLLNPINLIQKINDLIDVARSPLKRSTAYVVGDIAYVYALPSNLYLECTQAGTTSYYQLNLSTTVGAELTDGTVKWIVRDMNNLVKNSDVANKGNATTPVYFDANGAAQTTKNFSDYLPLLGGTMLGNILYPDNDTAHSIGYNYDEKKGGRLLLTNLDHETLAGGFSLTCTDGVSTYALKATVDELLWKTHPVLTNIASKISGTTGYLLLNNNLIIAWARVGTSSSTRVTVTKPYSKGFTTIIAVTGDSGTESSTFKGQCWWRDLTTSTNDTFRVYDTSDTFVVLWIGRIE